MSVTVAPPIGYLLNGTAANRRLCRVLFPDLPLPDEKQIDVLIKAIKLARQYSGDPNMFDLKIVQDVRIAFNDEVEPGCAMLSGQNAFPNITSKYGDGQMRLGLIVSQHDSPEMLANLLEHEIIHIRQFYNIHQTASIDSTAFLWKAQGDFGYLSIIRESEAYTQQIIHAYAMAAEALPEPLQAIKYGCNSVLVDCVEWYLHHGLDLSSDEMKQVLFDTWMLHPYSNRKEYDYGKFHLEADWDNRDKELGVSLRQSELASIAKETNGHSFLEGVDLAKINYLGKWAEYGLVKVPAFEFNSSLAQDYRLNARRPPPPSLS